MFFCFSVDDVGMEVFSSEKHLAMLLDFFEAEGIRATFFVVPRGGGKDLTQQPGYIALLKKASRAGHDVAQHGLEHDRFECGIPPRMILDLPHECAARERLATHRAEIEATLTVDRLRARLAAGRRILQSALSMPIAGFRAPCLSTCPNLFAALEAEGYRYDSSQYLQPAAWDILNGRADLSPVPITRKDFDRCQTGGTLKSFPLTGEYTWYLKSAAYNITLKLAKGDFDACLETGIPFVPLSHVSPIQEGDPDKGFSFYRELLGHARAAAESCGTRLACVTLSDACDACGHPNRGMEIS